MIWKTDLIPTLLTSYRAISQGKQENQDKQTGWQDNVCQSTLPLGGDVVTSVPAFTAGPAVPLMITAGSSTLDLMRFTPITVARFSTLILLTLQFSWISCRNLWHPGNPIVRIRKLPEGSTSRVAMRSQRSILTLSTWSQERDQSALPTSLALP